MSGNSNPVRECYTEDAKHVRDGNPVLECATLSTLTLSGNATMRMVARSGNDIH